MAQRKRRMKLSNLLSLILTIAIVITVGSALIAYTSRDYDTLGFGKFSRGTINTTTGMYEANDATLYTKELVPAMGLEVMPDFDGRVDYQLFWYNVDTSYMGYSDIITGNAPFRAIDVPSNAFYARIVLIPRDFLDENGNKNDDFKIAFYEVESYASDVKITYLKNQNFESKDLYSNAIISKSSFNDGFTEDVDRETLKCAIFDNLGIDINAVSEGDRFFTMEDKNTHLFVIATDRDNMENKQFYVENSNKITMYIVTGYFTSYENEIHCSKVDTLYPGKNCISTPVRGDSLIIFEIEGDPINEHINVYEFAGNNLGLIK